MSIYSAQPRDWIFEKGYGFLYFAKYMGKTIRKNKSKRLSDECSQKPVEHAKKSVTKALKTSSKRVIQIKAESAGDLIGNKIAKRIIKA